MWKPRRAGSVVTPGLGALFGTLITLLVWGRMLWPTPAFLFELAVRPATVGVTRLAVPPFGSVLAHTHPLPLELRLELREVYPERLSSLLAPHNDDAASLNAWALEVAERAVWRFVLRLLCLGALGGAGGALAARLVAGKKVTRRIALALLTSGAFAGVLFTGSVAAYTSLTYNRQAFDTPRFEGALEAAAWLVDLAQDALLHIEQLGERLKRLAESANAAFTRIDAAYPQGMPQTDTLVMHVSDIHNHVSALSFIDQVATSFEVDLIINTGDYTDFGTPPEAELVRPLGPKGTPNLFVSGNHETPEILQRLQKSGVNLIDGKTVTLTGLRIKGVGDPRSGRQSPASMDAEEITSLAAKVIAEVEGAPTPPDILAVHNFRVAQEIPPGLVPVVLCGHSHTASISQQGGTVYVNAGSTGAAGIRGLEAKEQVPFSLALLHFSRKEERPRLLAVDLLEVTSLAGGFRMQRYLVQPDGSLP